ncbi:unnamed protein product, partial [Sphagnum jensenii]
MAILPVRLYDDPILSKICTPVTDFSNLQELTYDMVETMNSYVGIGLAANQIGIDKSMAVLYLENKSKLLFILNPKIIGYTKESDIQLESCLSAPGISVNMKRYLGIDVECNDLEGNVVQYRFTDFDARIAQHEIDHLNG